MQNTYGLTKQNLKFVRKKLDFQKNFLKNTKLQGSNGELKSFLSLSYSANHSERYYGRLLNKINTMGSYARINGLVPVFMTATLDGYYRDLLLHGDYTRIYNMSIEKRKEFFNSIPQNPDHGYIKSKIRNHQKITVKDLYNILNHQWTSFLKSNPFKAMKKNGDQKVYIRSVEPHKNGVPHLHILMYLPEKYIKNVQAAFHRYFVAPRNRRKLNAEGETYGFQWKIRNPTGYILKYVTKSFLNVKAEKEVDYLQAWYIHHRITRVSTSKTLIPQWVFSKIASLCSDWYRLNDINKTGIAEWSKDDNYIYFYDVHNNEIYKVEDGIYSHIKDDEVVKQFHLDADYDVIDDSRYNPLNKTFTKVKKPRANSVFELNVNGVKQGDYMILEGNAIEVKNMPYQMSDLELVQYFNSLDIITCNPLHFNITHNEMIGRGLLQGEKMTLNQVQYEEVF